MAGRLGREVEVVLRVFEGKEYVLLRKLRREEKEEQWEGEKSYLIVPEWKIGLSFDVLEDKGWSLTLDVG